jgi:hypothetical protein
MIRASLTSIRVGRPEAQLVDGALSRDRAPDELGFAPGDLLGAPDRLGDLLSGNHDQAIGVAEDPSAGSDRGLSQPDAHADLSPRPLAGPSPGDAGGEYRKASVRMGSVSLAAPC